METFANRQQKLMLVFNVSKLHSQNYAKLIYYLTFIGTINTHNDEIQK